jgi:branched-chain amino acid transport system permease protein
MPMIQAAVAGLIAGGTYALLGVCLVLLYRMVGVLNFAQAAIGVFGTFVLFVAYGRGIPTVFGVLLGLGASALLGAFLGWVMSRWFAEARVETRSSVTIAMLIGLLALGLRLFGDKPLPTPTLFGGLNFGLLGVRVSLGTVVMLLLTVLIALGVSHFLNRTQVGLYLRALSERPTSAELLGVPAGQLTVWVWAITGAIAAAALMLIAPTRTPNFLSLSMLVLPSLAAALVGGFKAFPLTIGAGLVMGLIEGLAASQSGISAYRQVLPFVVTLVALLWFERKEVWDASR